MRKSRAPYFALAALVLCAALWTEIFLYSQNTLFVNDRWIVSQRMAGVGVAEGDSFLLTRSPMAGNMLHLGEWGGFKEVVSRFDAPFKSARFRFRVSDASSLRFSFNRTDQEVEGVHLGVGLGTSAIFHATPGGKLLSWSPLSAISLSTGWHHAELDAVPGGWELTLDGRKIAEGRSIRPLGGPIAFYGGLRGVAVADVAIETSNGRWTEDFRNRKNWLGAALSCILLLLAFSAVRYTTYWQNLLDLSVVGLVAGAIWFPFDYFYLSHTPTQEQVLSTVDIYGDEVIRAGIRIPESMRNRAELARFKLFDLWNRLVGGESIAASALAKRGYPVSRVWSGPIYCGPLTEEKCEQVDSAFMQRILARPKPGLEVVYVGSSQMVGAGAASAEQTLFARIHHALAKSGGEPLESLNLSMSGETARGMLSVYKQKYGALRPDLMAINLGNTDPTIDAYIDGLRGFLELNRANGTKTVIILQPVHPSAFGDSDMRYGKAKELAGRFGARVLPLYEYLRKPEVQKQGFLWQSLSHQTPFGQELVADWLIPRISAELTPVGRVR